MVIPAVLHAQPESSPHFATIPRMEIGSILERFVAGFNTNSLDDVMAFFAAEAVYRPGDGKEYRGVAAIRAAFRPQFSGSFGKMTFLVDDRVVDENARKAAIRWVCRHDFDTLVPLPKRVLWKTLFGRKSGWYGMDVFHFDEAGKIIGKFSYANYHFPRLRRDLGA